MAAQGDWLAPVFGGKILGGLFVWLGEAGLIQTFDRGTRAGQPVVDGIPMLIVWAIALVIFGHVLLDAHAVRQLDLRLGRRCAGGALCRACR